MECIPGLHFNSERGICDFPDQSNCQIEEDSGEGDKCYKGLKFKSLNLMTP